MIIIKYIVGATKIMIGEYTNSKYTDNLGW